MFVRSVIKTSSKLLFKFYVYNSLAITICYSFFAYRSGRKSKPPAHLAKDYKAIHRVDWYEDYDDDDGGYSDIYLSDEENNPQNSGMTLKSLIVTDPCYYLKYVVRKSLS